jgi:hypothetical protein
MLFEYAVVLQERRDRNTQQVIEAEQVIIAPGTLLAKDVNQATLMVAKKLDDKYVNDPDLADRLLIAVRPF